MARGDLPRAAEVFEDTAVAGRAAGKSPAVWAMASQSCAQRGLGKLHLAVATCREAIAWSATVNNPHELHPLGIVYAALADVQREWNHLDLAMRHAMEGLRLWPTLKTYRATQVVPHLVLARIKQAQGDLEGALAAVRQAKQLGQKLEAAGYLAILSAFEAQVWLMQGHLAAAIAWAERLERETDRQPGRLDAFRFIYSREHLAIAPIQVLIARGRAAGDSAYVRAALDRLQQQGQDPTWADVAWLRIKRLVLEALAHQALGELTPALVAIEQALALAEPEGYIRVFADEGPPVADLLRQVRTHGSGTDCIGAILAVLERHGLRDIAPSTQPGSEYFGLPLAEPLSAREFEVLRLLAVGQSNPEIARTLYVEVTTVKTHIRNLYGKLGVHNRVEAVQRARELTLL
jgi:LuxR family maltose regulon positive regulatory protein